MTDPRAGQPAASADLVDVAKLVTAYFTVHPDPDDPGQRVAFGTSGHRGSAFTASFNEDHILATSQAICEYRTAQGIDGPLFLGVDTHALSEPATVSALEVLLANGVEVLVDSRGGYTPTPSVSRAILVANAGGARADGICVTPSHNPPADGGFKYNPPDGGPAGTDITGWIQDRANELLRTGLAGVKRVSLASAAPGTYDFLDEYVGSLGSVVDLDAIRGAGIRIGADPLGGASVAYWGVIGERYGLDLTVVNPDVDPTFRFMTLDWDGRIRMDCSSPYAMASLIARQADFDIATGNDTDSDRHGIVTPDAGLMNPNHFLAVAISYLYAHREGWSADAAVGKTLVSSSMIDRVVAGLGRRLLEVPVGFKWFVPGLLDGSVAFGGEESAGASFLQRDGSVWTTDKDGIILCLLASEIAAVTGSSPSQLYRGLTELYGEPAYARIDSPATREQKAILAKLSPDQVSATSLAGEPITATLTSAPGNGAPLGGLKVVTENAWFAARPSGTEDVYKLYAESFRGPSTSPRCRPRRRPSCPLRWEHESVIHHISIPATDTRHVAEVLVEIFGGELSGFGPYRASWIAWAADDVGAAIEVYPVGTELYPPAGPGQALFRHDAAASGFSATHAAVSVDLSAEQIVVIGEREGWRAERCSRGPHDVIELWIENRVMLELMTPEMTADYLAAAPRRS